MTQFKKAQIVMLPTYTESKLYLASDNKLNLAHINYADKVLPGCFLKHLYVISEDKIEEDDWFILNMSDNARPDELHQMGKNNYSKTGGISFKEENSWTRACKKVIATTNEKLGLAKPAQDFIRKYISSYNKGKIIRDVHVEYECILCFKEPKCTNCYSKCLIGYKLKVHAETNTVNIKKLQESWNREGIRALFLEFGTDATTKQIKFGHIPSEFVADELEINNWLNNKL